MNDTLWVMHAPVLSTGHLSLTTMGALSNSTNAFDLFCIPYERGVLVFCSDIADACLRQDLPEDLAMCLRWSARHGYEWTRFDADGSTVDVLPTYSWEH